MKTRKKTNTRSKRMKRKQTMRGGSPMMIAGIAAGILVLAGASFAFKGQTDKNANNEDMKRIGLSEDFSSEV